MEQISQLVLKRGFHHTRGSPRVHGESSGPTLQGWAVGSQDWVEQTARALSRGQPGH